MNILYLENQAVFAQQVTRQFLSVHRVTVVPSLSAAGSALAAGGFEATVDEPAEEDFVFGPFIWHPDSMAKEGQWTR